jgi:hypothetical protein
MALPHTAFRLLSPTLLLAATVTTAVDPPVSRPANRAAAWPATVVLQSSVAGQADPGSRPLAGSADGPDTQAGPGVEPSTPAGAPPDTLLPLHTAGPHVTMAPPRGTGAARTYKVYATREGLVGHITANGHRVVANDHFVSLPSWTVLSAKGASTYSVRVCATGNGRCVYEPVWDVGPWNTRDNYWAANRETWPKLARGRPEAQAAFDDNFHGGKDQFGREVVNPAGLDLADGTIRDGLGYSSSAWVNVTYLWTGGGHRGTVHTNGGVLNVRRGPTTATPIVGLAGPYARLPLKCQKSGQLIGTTKTWYRVGPGNYVSAAHVAVSATTRKKIKSC